MSPVAEAEKKTVDGVMLIGSIKVKENVRKFFEPKAMGELTENIKKVGVLQPLIVRMVNGRPELIAGERRLRSAKSAGLETVPVRIIDVDDQAALEIQAFENLHRKDLGPIEEARAFQMLIRSKNEGHKPTFDVASLAERVDKSEAYVRRSLRLLELPDQVLEMIESGKLTPAHGHQILRVPADQRADVIEIATGKENVHWRRHTITAVELAEEVEQRLGQWLHQAPFPKDKPFAGQVACKVCPYNSANQGELALDIEKSNSKCLNAPCFETKLKQCTEDVRAEASKEKNFGKDFGIFTVDYAGRIEGKKEMVTIRDVRITGLKALMKKHPEKFGFVVSPATRHDAPKVHLVCSDRTVLPKEKKRPAMSQSGSGAPMSAREKFINEAANKAVLDACFNAAKKIEPEVVRPLAELAMEMCDSTEELDELYKRKGVKLPGTDRKASAGDLVRVAFLACSMDWEGAIPEAAAKKIGVDYAIIRAAAKKAAGAEFDAKKTAAPAKAKKKA